MGHWWGLVSLWKFIQMSVPHLHAWLEYFIQQLFPGLFFKNLKIQSNNLSGLQWVNASDSSNRKMQTHRFPDSQVFMPRLRTYNKLAGEIQSHYEKKVKDVNSKMEKLPTKKPLWKIKRKQLHSLTASPIQVNIKAISVQIQTAHLSLFHAADTILRQRSQIRPGTQRIHSDWQHGAASSNSSLLFCKMMLQKIPIYSLKLNKKKWHRNEHHVLFSLSVPFIRKSFFLLKGQGYRIITMKQ